MCGISGIAGAQDLVGAERFVRNMNEALRHRGPDGEGIWSDGVAVLGHRRLSIIDLSERGAQPMKSADKRFTMVCNGEIYNYRALRRELEANGRRFVSDTDVEVILHLYDLHGVRCLEYLEGMFAFAIWDSLERKLFAARDRVGEKPFYYVDSFSGFAFASEVKALLTLPWVRRNLDEQALACLPVYQSVPAPLTFFRDVRALPPASWLIWQDGRREEGRYWQIDFSKRRPWRWTDAVECYNELLGSSVKGCMEADVSVGVTLSGGVDSSAITVNACELEPRIQTFCVGTNGPHGRDPEFVLAEDVAARLGTRHTSVEFALDNLLQLPLIISHYDQPLNSPAIIYADPLMRLVKQHVKVVLNGNAADELFAGYSGYNSVVMTECLAPLLRLIPLPLKHALGARFGRLADAGYATASSWRPRQIDLDAQDKWKCLFTKSFCERLGDYSPGLALGGYASECHPNSFLDSVRYTDLMLYHHHGHAIIPDIAGMAHGLEVRAPFLNHRLIEFAATLPGKMILPNVFCPRHNKAIMKRSLLRHLPRRVVYAPKKGFGCGIDLPGMMRGPWRAVVEDTVLHGRYLELGLISPVGARWALDNSFGTSWAVFVFSIWADIYLLGETVNSVRGRFVELLGGE